jgi:hypothetical protein
MSIYNYLVAILPIVSVAAVIAVLHFFPASRSHNRLHPGE